MHSRARKSRGRRAALGILEDEESVPDLDRASRASRDISVAVQALGALNSLSKKIPVSLGDEPDSRARSHVAVARANDATSRSRRRRPASARSLARLARVASDARRESPSKGVERADGSRLSDAPRRRARAGDGRKRIDGRRRRRLSSCVSARRRRCEFFEGEGSPWTSWRRPFSTTRPPRVRAAALSSLSKRRSPQRSAWLLAGLIDRDPAVRAVALEESAPLVDDSGR